MVKPRGEAEQVGRREEAKVAGSENISFRGTVTARVAGCFLNNPSFMSYSVENLKNKGFGVMLYLSV